MLYYVYAHIRHDTGDIFYIGMGSGNRAYDTRKRNSFWRGITGKTSYSVKVLFSGLTHEQAIRKEIRLIKLIGRRNNNLGTLCNLTDGGEGCSGYKASEQTRERLRSSGLKRRATPETKAKLSKARLGYKLPIETRKKISQARLTNNWSNGRHISVTCTKTGMIFQSIKDAALYFDIQRNYLCNMLRGKRKNKTSLVLSD